MLQSTSDTQNPAVIPDKLLVHTGEGMNLVRTFLRDLVQRAYVAIGACCRHARRKPELNGPANDPDRLYIESLR